MYKTAPIEKSFLNALRGKGLLRYNEMISEIQKVKYVKHDEVDGLTYIINGLIRVGHIKCIEDKYFAVVS